MKFFIVLAFFVAAAFAETQVLRSEHSVEPESFNIVLELDDGHVEHQQGTLKASGDGEALSQTGDFGWTSPEGDKIAVQYVADENGYQPTGEHIPTPPPIPEYILKSIEYINAHPQ